MQILSVLTGEVLFKREDLLCFHNPNPHEGDFLNLGDLIKDYNKLKKIQTEEESYKGKHYVKIRGVLIDSNSQDIYINERELLSEEQMMARM